MTHDLALAMAQDIGRYGGSRAFEKSKGLAFGWYVTEIQTYRTKRTKRKNSFSAGIANPKAKLTAIQVMEIRNSTESRAVVAARHSINIQTVSRIRNNKSWAA